MHALSDPPLVCTMTEDSLWWLVLLARPKWGPARVLRGVETAGSPQEVWDQVDAVHPKTERALASAAKLPLQDVRRRLFTLEFQGWVLRLPGRRYLRR